MHTRPSEIVNIMSKSMERTVKMSRAELCICTPGDAQLQASSREASPAQHWSTHTAPHVVGGKEKKYKFTKRQYYTSGETQRMSTVVVHADTSFMAKAGTGSALC